jgi:hypothetical protein
MPFGMEKDAKDWRDDVDAPLRCMGCSRIITSGWRCKWCRAEEGGEA